MKKTMASVVVLGLLAGGGLAYAGLPAATGVNGSRHDMRAVVGPDADSMGRVCVFCHTPHNAESNAANENDQAPLWNRDYSGYTYTAYQWVTPANRGDDFGTSFQIDDPLIGPSRLCMSCHDGGVAVDQHGRAMAQPGTTTIGNITGGNANLGQDLTKTHPIGFSYPQIMAWRNSIAQNGDATGTEIVDPVNGFATSIDTKVTQGTYNIVERKSARRIQDVLYNGEWMTCASCHEVHNKENATQNNFHVNGLGLDTTKAPNYFLYAKQEDSLICLSCHVK